MKAAIKYLLLAIITQFSVVAFANDFAAVVGLRSNSADSPTSGNSINSKTGVGLGVIGIFDLNEAFQMRTGFLYNQRNFEVKGTLANTDLNLAYVDIPVTGMYKFADYAGAFAGPVLSLLASKECKTSSGTCVTSDNPSGLALGLQLGVHFKFAAQLGAELYYEMISGQFWKNQLENSRTVGFNFLFTFE